MSPRTDDVAVVIVAHGERGGRADNALLLLLRDQVASAMAGVPVHAGVLNGAPTFEDALRSVTAAHALIYPFFMSDGYFARTVVPQRVAAAGIGLSLQQLPPLGLDTALPALIHARALALTCASGWQPRDCRLLLVGHGSSKSDASARSTLTAAAAIERLGGFQAIKTAFLEQPPLLANALADDGRQTIVVGFLSGEGLHGIEDVPAALAKSSLPTRYAGPIGAADGIAALIAAQVARSMGT